MNITTALKKATSLTPEEFIEKAVEAGWDNKKAYIYCPLENDNFDHALIDPTAWSAVGKSMGWMDEVYAHPIGDITKPQWVVIWHRFIDYLCEYENN
jgi:hypothetical protein